MIDVQPLSDRFSGNARPEGAPAALPVSEQIPAGEVVALREELAQTQAQLRQALDLLHEVTEGKSADAH